MFSPNEDGTHDFLRVKGKNIAEIDWSIYDSFGKLLYRATSVSEASTKGWDGTFQGRPLQSDVYVWTLKGRFSDGSPLPQKAGSVLLIR
jgi:gliding motility-associated-like protein